MCAVRGGLKRVAERTYLNFNGPAKEQQRLGPDRCRLTDIHLGRLHLLMEYEPPLRQRPECKHHRALHNTPPQPRRHRMRSFAPAAAQLSSAQLSSARAGVAQIYLNRFADRTGCRATSASRVRSRQAAARSAKPSAVVLEGHDSMCATGRSQPTPRDNARHRRCGRAGARSRRKRGMPRACKEGAQAGRQARGVRWGRARRR